MKKVRGIQVDFWTDEKVVSVSPLARLLWLGSWHYCCDQGHLEATPLELKMRVLPADNCDIEALFGELLDAGLVVGDPQTGYSVPNLPEHQHLDKRWLIRCERCTDTSGGTREDHARSAREDHARSTRAAREDSKGPRADVDVDGDGECEGGAGDKPRAKAPRQRGSRLPDIFPITDEMRDWGRDKAPDVDAAREHEKFCDYWRGVSGQRGVKADWVATWRNWMRRAQDDITARQPKDEGHGLPDWMLA